MSRGAAPPPPGENRPPLVTTAPQTVREEAERRLAARKASGHWRKPENIPSLLHELEVHQIELELQNEELRRTQNELERSRERYLDLYDVAPVGYAVLDDKGLIQEANLTLTSRLGGPRTAFVGRPLRRFVDPASQDSYLLHLQRLFETGEPSSFDVDMVTKDGTSFRGRLDAVVHDDDSSGSRSCRVTLTDVTDLKRAEEDVRAGKEVLQNVLDSVPQAIFWKDRNSVYLGGNRTFARAAGLFDPEKIVRKTDFDLPWRTEEAEAYRADDAQVMGSGFPKRHIVERQRKADGTDLWIDTTKVPLLDARGEVRGVLGVYDDITERKRDEEALRESEERYRRLSDELERRVRERTAELEEANRELGAFSYSISHELRSPLRAIDGFSARVSDSHAGLLDDEGRRLFAEVRWNAQRMGRLIDDLLAFSRARDVDLSLGSVNMTGAARAAFALAVPEEASRSRISLSVDDLPDAHGDARLLGRVWENLLSNAVKFSAGREKPEIQVEGDILGGEAVYRVRDNGVGFDMEYVDKLFGVFHRLHGQREFEGTGVGLALVRRIVTRHGGKVWAEGEVGKGATFSFSLPVAAPSGLSTSLKKLGLPPGTTSVP